MVSPQSDKLQEIFFTDFNLKSMQSTEGIEKAGINKLSPEKSIKNCVELYYAQQQGELTCLSKILLTYRMMMLFACFQ